MVPDRFIVCRGDICPTGDSRCYGDASLRAGTYKNCLPLWRIHPVHVLLSIFTILPF